jgi:hypothetical protein
MLVTAVSEGVRGVARSLMNCRQAQQHRAATQLATHCTSCAAYRKSVWDCCDAVKYNQGA